MNLVVIGVNHKTAPVELRGRLSFSSDDIHAAQTQLQKITAGSVIISTCNRTEIYALVPTSTSLATSTSTSTSTLSTALTLNSVNPSSSMSTQLTPDATLTLIEQLTQWIASFKQLPIQQVRPYLYDYIDAQALTHWLRVASGLDSMILGEPQIFGQIKKSVNQAKAGGFLGSHLNWVAEQIFAAAKQVRNDTDVGTQAISLGFATAKLVTQIFDNPKATTLLVIAAGEMNRLVAQHVAALGVQRIMICNRSLDRAHLLASQLQFPDMQIEVYPLSELANLLPQADIVSSCSASMDVLIDKKMTKRALKIRRYQPILMVDLAVPNDIEPSVGKLDDVYLYSIDDLQHVIAGNLEKRRQAAVEAELLVSQLVVEIERRYQVRKVGQDIYDYRAEAAQKADAELQKALQQLKVTPDNPEVILAELTRRLTQTLTHAPSHLMREVAREGDAEVVDTVITGLKEAYRPVKMPKL